jgi:aspartate aminotransferase
MICNDWLRIGYIGLRDIAKACNKLQGQFTSGVCSIAQRAALAALQGKDNSQRIMREAFLRRRDLICNLLKEVEGMKVSIPQGAFYVMPDITNFIGKHNDTKSEIDDLFLYLLDSQVATVEEMLSAPDCLRISYATADSFNQAVKRIKEALKI